jgi:hypothetical protein
MSGVSDGVDKADYRKSVLMEAEEIINGQRRQDYGSVTESFENVAGLWSEYLSRHVNGNNNIAHPVQLKGEDIANLMILMKVSRAQNGFHRDSYVDIAGYSGCAEKLQDERR